MPLARTVNLSTGKSTIPKRASEISPFYVMDILEKAKEMEAAGKDVIHLEVGEPDFQTPDCIKEKAIKVIKEGKLGYTPSLGLPELRKAIANRYKSRYGVAVLPEQVVITSGSSPALQMVFSCLLEEGDEVIMTDPHYACYSNFVKFLGGKPVLIETKEEDNFRLMFFCQTTQQTRIWFRPKIFQTFIIAEVDSGNRL